MCFAFWAGPASPASLASCAFCQLLDASTVQQDLCEKEQLTVLPMGHARQGSVWAPTSLPTLKPLKRSTPIRMHNEPIVCASMVVFGPVPTRVRLHGSSNFWALVLGIPYYALIALIPSALSLAQEMGRPITKIFKHYLYFFLQNLC